MATAYTPTEGLIWRDADDGLVIVAPNAGKVRVLNGVGALLWQMIVDEQTDTAMQAHLIQEFGSSAERASADVNTFLTDLKARTLITPA